MAEVTLKFIDEEDGVRLAPEFQLTDEQEQAKDSLRADAEALYERIEADPSRAKDEAVQREGIDIARRMGDFMNSLTLAQQLAHRAVSYIDTQVQRAAAQLAAEQFANEIAEEVVIAPTVQLTAQDDVDR